jgi:hypothetical protein
LEDFNRSISVAPVSMLTGSYSVGPDNRGCVTLAAASTGGTQTFRIALGTISGGAATQGAITRFDDTTGQNPRVAGILKQQNLAALDSSTLSGTYAFGEEGVDGGGYRIAAAGLLTLDGAGNITNLTVDVNDGGNAATIPGGSGSYSLAANAPSGRGTFQTTIPTGGGPATSNAVVYVISPSDFFFMTTDLNGAGLPLLIGEAKLQTGPFSTSALGGNGYVFYASGIDSSNGGNIITLGQLQFTDNSGGATLTFDTNDYGVDAPEVSAPVTGTLDPTGRMTVAGVGSPQVIYLVDSTQGFVVGMGASISSGYVEQQTLSSFSTSAISGQFFIGGGAPTTGSTFDSATAVFSPAEPAGTITGISDSSGSNCEQNPADNCQGHGMRPNNPIPVLPYTFSASPAAPGQGCIGIPVAGPACAANGGLIGYIVSPTEIVFMQTGTAGNPNPAEIFIVRQ